MCIRDRALLAAVAIVLVAFVHFPLIPAAPFLEYDPADIPIFIGAFLFGPWAGLGLTVVTAIIQGLDVYKRQVKRGTAGNCSQLYDGGNDAFPAFADYAAQSNKAVADGCVHRDLYGRHCSGWAFV